MKTIINFYKDYRFLSLKISSMVVSKNQFKATIFALLLTFIYFLPLTIFVAQMLVYNRLLILLSLIILFLLIISVLSYYFWYFKLLINYNEGVKNLKTYKIFIFESSIIIGLMLTLGLTFIFNIF